MLFKLKGFVRCVVYYAFKPLGLVHERPYDNGSFWYSSAISLGTICLGFRQDNGKLQFWTGGW